MNAFTLLSVLLALAGVLWWISPKGYVIHAARTGDLLFKSRRFPLAALYRDQNGDRIDLDGRMIGLVKGNSCATYGLRDGDIVVAERLDDPSTDSRVEEGDLVIINSEVDGDRPYRFRKVRAIEGDMVSFVSDPKGPLKSKPFDDIVGKVAFVGHR